MFKANLLLIVMLTFSANCMTIFALTAQEMEVQDDKLVPSSIPLVLGGIRNNFSVLLGAPFKAQHPHDLIPKWMYFIIGVIDFPFSTAADVITLPVTIPWAIVQQVRKGKPAPPEPTISETPSEPAPQD